MIPGRVVLDTNVLVSALLNSFRAPGRVLDLALAGELIVAHDDRILAEWQEVLRREKFGFAPADVDALLSFIEREGLKVNPPVLTARLPDPDDLPFLEVALAVEAALITGNLRHYPSEARGEAEVVDAGDFLRRWAARDLAKPHE